MGRTTRTITASKPEVYLKGGPDSAGAASRRGRSSTTTCRSRTARPLMQIRSVAAGADGSFRVSLPVRHDDQLRRLVQRRRQHRLGARRGRMHKERQLQGRRPRQPQDHQDHRGRPGASAAASTSTSTAASRARSNRTIVFPSPGFVTISGIDALAECTVSETGTPRCSCGLHVGCGDLHRQSRDDRVRKARSTSASSTT